MNASLITLGSSFGVLGGLASIAGHSMFSAGCFAIAAISFSVLTVLTYRKN